jgi:hypothetical protein
MTLMQLVALPALVPIRRSCFRRRNGVLSWLDDLRFWLQPKGSVSSYLKASGLAMIVRHAVAGPAVACGVAQPCMCGRTNRLRAGVSNFRSSAWRWRKLPSTSALARSTTVQAFWCGFSHFVARTLVALTNPPDHSTRPTCRFCGGGIAPITSDGRFSIECSWQLRAMRTVFGGADQSCEGAGGIFSGSVAWRGTSGMGLDASGR